MVDEGIVRIEDGREFMRVRVPIVCDANGVPLYPCDGCAADKDGGDALCSALPSCSVRDAGGRCTDIFIFRPVEDEVDDDE